MKTRILALSVTAAIVLATIASAETLASKPAVSIKSEQHPSFTSLRTHRQGKGITATWSMSGLDGIVGFTIQRTYEDPSDVYAYWEELCTMPCDAIRHFSYTDKEVFPGVVNYRVAALMEDGNIVYSELSSVRIVSRK